MAKNAKRANFFYVVLIWQLLKLPYL